MTMNEAARAPHGPSSVVKLVNVDPRSARVVAGRCALGDARAAVYGLRKVQLAATLYTLYGLHNTSGPVTHFWSASPPASGLLSAISLASYLDPLVRSCMIRSLRDRLALEHQMDERVRQRLLPRALAVVGRAQFESVSSMEG